MYENRNKQHSSASYFCCCVVTISVLNPYSCKSVFLLSAEGFPRKNLPPSRTVTKTYVLHVPW